MKNVLNFVIIILLITVVSCKKQQKIFTENDINIIPKPVKLKLAQGVFEFTKNTQFVVTNKVQKEISNTLIDKFQKATGWQLEITEKIPQKNYIQFILDSNFKKETYKLEVFTNKITITASGNAGFLYGLESIRQLLPEAIESPKIVPNVDWVIPNVEVQDQPRFKWRGLMLDLSRHFFDKEYIKEVIDGLAMLKMNVLHLHLVDDQGWRIEIKKYPKLTEVGAWRVNQEDKQWNDRNPNSPNQKGTYGGFLTQDDLKELVKYAQIKNVEIIPEIEMPAHVTSAIAAYPKLSCFENPVAVGVPSGGVWPITDIYCAGKESTFKFLESVLLEVMDIFPSKYIHIGGDEATKTNWKKCPYCKKRMKKEGLHNVEELQSYFVKRIEKFINSKGKKLIGWDEILEGGVAPDATVMSWRGVKGGIEATKQGHDVVMTPGEYCYFDHYQGPQNEEPLAIGGFLPISKVYQFDPVVSTMTAKEKAHVLGGQANLWSEYISSEKQSQYMIYPRLSALSETLWSPKKLRNWEDFSRRLLSMFKRYDYLGINYAKSVFLVTAKAKFDLQKKLISLTLQNEFPGADIRYVLEENKLDKKAIRYTNPIELTKTTIIKASLFKNNKPIGKIFIDTIKFDKAVAHKVDYVTKYNERYQGTGVLSLVNTSRGSKSFHDGQWQAWLGDNMEVNIDLEDKQSIHQVLVGSMENQGSEIYFPTKVAVLVSNDGKNYHEVGITKRAYIKNAISELKDFVVEFKKQNVRYVKVKASCLKKTPNKGDTWLFVDEILID